MISCVYLTGRLGDPIGPNARNVEVDRLIPGSDGRYATDIIPVKTMLSMEGLFMKAKKGSLIIVKGRLECDPVHGLIIIDELDEIYTHAVETTTVKECLQQG